MKITRMYRIYRIYLNSEIRNKDLITQIFYFTQRRKESKGKAVYPVHPCKI